MSLRQRLWVAACALTGGLALVVAGCAPKPILVRTSPEVSVATMSRLALLPFVSAAEVSDPAVAQRLAEALTERLHREGGYEIVGVAAEEKEEESLRLAYFRPDVAARAAARVGAVGALTGFVAECRTSREPSSKICRTTLTVGVRVTDAASGEVVLNREEEVEWYSPPTSDPSSAAELTVRAEEIIVRRLCRSFIPILLKLPLPRQALFTAADYFQGVPVGRRREFTAGSARVPLILALPAAYDRVFTMVEVRKEDRVIQEFATVWEARNRFTCFYLRVAELLVSGGPGVYKALCLIGGRQVDMTEFELRGEGWQEHQFPIKSLRGDFP